VNISRRQDLSGGRGLKLRSVSIMDRISQQIVNVLERLDETSRITVLKFAEFLASKPDAASHGTADKDLDIKY